MAVVFGWVLAGAVSAGQVAAPGAEPEVVEAAPEAEPEAVGPVEETAPVADPEATRVERPEVIDVSGPRMPDDRPPRVRPRVMHALGVRGGMVVGATSSPAGGVALVYGLDRGLLRVEGRVLYSAPRQLSGGPEVRVQALTLGALACVAFGSEVFRVPLCLGAEAGPWMARVGETRLRTELWASGLFGATIWVRAHRRVAVVLATEFAVALRRPWFRVDEREPLVRSPAVGARVLLGVEFLVGRR